jgi:hypothetical protein
MIEIMFKIGQVYEGNMLGETMVPGAVPPSFLYNKAGPSQRIIDKAPTKYQVKKMFDVREQDAQVMDSAPADIGIAEFIS